MEVFFIMKKGKGCLIVIGFVIILGIVGNMIGNKQSNVQTQQNQKSKYETKEPELTATAEEISKKYKENEVNGEKTYEGKIVKIKGNVIKVGSGDIDDKKFVLLKGFGGLDVHCYFEDKNTDGIEKLVPGDEVTITGRIYDKFISVLVEDCILN